MYFLSYKKHVVKTCMYVLHFSWHKFIILMHLPNHLGIVQSVLEPKHLQVYSNITSSKDSFKQKYSYTYDGLRKFLYVCYLKLQVHLC